MIPPPSRTVIRPAGKVLKRTPGAKRIRGKELATFTRQFAEMLAAGIPILASLDGLYDQTGNDNLRNMILEIKTSIEDGHPFSEAITAYPDVFDDLYVNMIRAGEMTGQLPETAMRIAEFLEKNAKIKRKVRSSMAYPLAIVMIALAITSLMITFIVPVFSEMFEGFGAKLPGPTQFLVNVSRGFRRWVPYAAVFVVAVVFAFKKWQRTRSGAYMIDRMMLSCPIAGTLIQKLALGRFARLFAQLTNSGVHILSSLEILAGATGNAVIGRAIRNAAGPVQGGAKLSECLRSCAYISPLMIHMMSAAEKTGKVSDMMLNVADFYDDEVQNMLNGLISLMEPMLIAFLGIFVGGIVICMFLPVFKLTEAAGVM